MQFPTRHDGSCGTTLLLDDSDRSKLPVVRAVNAVGLDDSAAALAALRPGCALLQEHSAPTFLRPGLSGHRLSGADGAGGSWSTKFETTDVTYDDAVLRISARDDLAGLAVETTVEALTGGALRIRHRLTNEGAAAYVLDALEVSLPLPDDHVELLDFTGRHERERSPQRHPLADGVWLRESRTGRAGLDSPSMIVAGTAGFGFGHGDVIALAVGAVGNGTMSVARSAAEAARISGGELLLPGEIVLKQGESYETPWVFVVAADDGLDGAAAALHRWQRSLPAHPGIQPVTLNVWEAVYFDHDLPRLKELANRAARVGVERFVLDDGWFHARRDATAGLGDWWVDPDVWPQGLTPLIDHVHALGMQFGLWFEPEMVNPDSDYFRAHPDWVLSAKGRLPVLKRNQFVADLSNPQAWQHIHDSIDAVLQTYDVDYVKWDHNRELLEAGSPARDGAPVAHRQAAAYLALLDALRQRHSGIAWESCASGGGRIDLGTVEHVQRFWTSDMTDALSRQQIQRWAGQLIAPEYLGAHISSPTSHQTGRTLSLDFRAATALFGSFGIEWDLTLASEEDLDRLASWCAIYREHRELLQSGTAVRLDCAEPTVIAHGVVGADGRDAIIAVVQLDEAASNRGVTLRIPRLQDELTYRGEWLGPVDLKPVSHTVGLPEGGPFADAQATGAALSQVGVWLPRRRPETITLLRLRA
ncbi:alpha-galactosidase [Rudaeicoccus suwonensis]|uniref:alpha-galactosidase n=1 Tax=Rudaeicoccus suwonensis TaxID=657409 RepID=A0A561E9G0_9MICO|nr:alpha-galactosidase [Rudaeicoccus suwonensis]TWE12241.1 alpha-galactosidase [Rudaeicoccus suwonensis]